MSATLSNSELEPPSSNLGSFIAVEISDVSGSYVDPDPLEQAIQGTLESHGISNVEVSVLLTTDEHIRSLNLQYRGQDEPTDVLSFGANSEIPLPFPQPLPYGTSIHGERESGPPNLLGDIVISVPYAIRQAQARKVPLNLELCYLAIHGALHLIGFQDETDDEREGMMREMSKMAVAAGLPTDPEWSSILHSVEEGTR